MVERVTRAILPAFDHIKDPAYRKVIAGCWARAAIRAMRDPTDEMVIAGDNEAIDVLNDNTFALKEPTLAHRVHVAMIDVALLPDRESAR